MTPVSNTPAHLADEPKRDRVRDLDTAAIAERFLAARRGAEGLADYPGAFPETLDQAYAIQDCAIAGWDRPIIGWKVGRINSPLAERYGADRLAGPIFASKNASPGSPPAMPVFTQGFVAAEAEFLLRIARPPTAGQRKFSIDEAASLIDAVHVGIEIASSPFGAINALGPVAIISDFGNNNGLVIGAEISGWRDSGFEQWPVATRIDGDDVGTGVAASFPDGAIGSARFLFELLARRNILLAPGQWISSGAVSGVHVAQAGQVVEARFGDDLILACKLTAAGPDQA